MERPWPATALPSRMASMLVPNCVFSQVACFRPGNVFCEFVAQQSCEEHWSDEAIIAVCHRPFLHRNLSLN